MSEILEQWDREMTAKKKPSEWAEECKQNRSVCSPGLLLLLDRIAELESAQTPRPMSEAPKDGTEILGTTSSTGCDRIYYVMWWLDTADGWVGHHRDYWCPDGWLPLPVGQEEKSTDGTR